MNFILIIFGLLKIEIIITADSKPYYLTHFLLLRPVFFTNHNIIFIAAFVLSFILNGMFQSYSLYLCFLLLFFRIEFVFVVIVNSFLRNSKPIHFTSCCVHSSLISSSENINFFLVQIVLYTFYL